MLKITAWGKDKPLFPALAAQIIAITPLTLNKYLTAVREFKNIRNVPQPKSRLWLSLYRKNRHLKEKIILNLLENSLTARQIKLLFDYYLKIYNFPANSEVGGHFNHKINRNSFFEPILKFIDSFPKITSKAHPLLTMIYKLTSKFIENDIEDEKKPKVYSDNDDHKIFTSEILFFIKVIFPCWIFYNDHHSFILRRARQGDVGALQDILRLDKSLVGDRLINKQIIESISNDPIKLRFITKAIQEKPKEQDTLPRIKASLAGLISLVSEKFGHKFNAPEIRELFDAVAVDYGRDEQIDTDLPNSEEAFQKAIQRAKPFWQSSFD